MCLTPDDPPQGARDAIDAGDEMFVNAPPSDDPASRRQEDAVPYRLTLETWVESLRAEAGLPALSAAMYRRRRALDHHSRALEFVQRHRVAVGLEEDELCRSVQAALDTQTVGSCAYCGCNFSVVAAVDVPGLGLVCGVCGRGFRAHNPMQREVPNRLKDAEPEEHNPVPQEVADPPEDAERWKGWLPW